MSTLCFLVQYGPLKTPVWNWFFFFNELPFLQAINEDATFQPSANALCRKRDICYSEKTSTLEFFFTYLEIKIIHEIYITWKMMIWSFSIIFFKFFFSYFIENFEAENNFWSQHCRRLQLIYLFFYSLDYYLSRKIGHRHCCVRKI